LDFNGDINTADWQIFLASAGTTFVDMTDAETYAFGDLNGDGVSNVADFRLFKADYLAANPPGSGAVSFDELAGAVPEPATLTLFAMSLAGVALWPRQRRRTRPVVATRPRVLSRRRMPAGLAFCLLAVVVVASMQSNADAVLRHRYNFNTDVAALGMFEDLVGNADGTLFGAATVAGGQLVLPGGGAAKAGDHAQLLANGANGININTYTNASFESWVTVNDEAELWARIFDFGGHSISAPTNAGNSIFMTQNAGGANDVRFAISNVDINTQSGFQGEQTANTNTNLVNGAETHLVGVFNGDANVMQLYVNGALVGTNNNATFQLELLQTDFALLGAALYNDPSLNGSINDFRVYDHALTTSDIGKNSILGPERTGEILKLVVNTTGAGSVTVVNEQGDLPIDIDYYKISSAMGALNPGGWMSFDDGESDAPGLGWDEGASNVNALQEFVLGGGSAGETFAAGGMTSLGNAFNTSTFGAGNPGDLMFEYGGPSGFLIQGAVEYVTTPAVLGDYNGDGTVNAADYTVYRNRKAGIGGTTLMNEGPGITPGVVTVEDYNYWKSRYGATSGSGATVGGGDVPEPATLVSLVLGGLLMFGCSIGRRRVR
jgi:hypothetical protein